MSQLFSTKLLPASDRIDAWQWNARQICGDCRIRLPKASFNGTIDVRDVAGLPLTRFSSSPLSFSKAPSDNRRPENHFCIVITQFAGVRCYEQNGASALLQPGDSTLIDSTVPWSSNCNTDCSRLYLRVPRWIMEDHLRRTEIPIARRINGNTRDGAILCQIAQSLYGEAERMTKEEAAAALEAYFEVLAACLGQPHSGSRAVELRGQIHRYIELHLSETTLRPADIAFSMGISIRHLHRLFLVTGNTLGEYIRRRRLRGCRADLANPKMREKTITDIAFFWGFCDSAHFSHSFKKEFGISPRVFRTRALAGDCAREDCVRDLLHAEIAGMYSGPN